MSVQRHLTEPPFYYQIGPYINELQRSLKAYGLMLQDKEALKGKYKILEDPNLNLHLSPGLRDQARVKDRESLALEESKLQAVYNQSMFRIATIVDKLAGYWPDIIFDLEGKWMTQVQFDGYLKIYLDVIRACTALKIPLRQSFDSVQVSIKRYLPIEEVKINK